MVSRREALKNGGAKQAKLTDDRRIRDFIENPTFLLETSSSRLDFNVPVFHIERTSEPSGPTNVVVTHSETSSKPQVRLAEATEEGKETPPRKKKRVVRFADD